MLLSSTSLNVSPTSFHLSLLWSGSRLACLALPCICLPFPFICLPLLFICLPGWVLVVGFPGGLSPTSLHLSPTFPTVRGVINSFLRRVRPLCHCWCPPISTGHVTFLFIRLSGLSLLVRPFPLAMQHFYSCVSQVCHWWCPPFPAGRSCSISFHLSPKSVTAGDATFLFICLPGVSLLMSALFRWPCSISVHLSPRPVTGPFLLDLSAASVTAAVRPFPLAM